MDINVLLRIIHIIVEAVPIIVVQMNLFHIFLKMQRNYYAHRTQQAVILVKLVILDVNLYLKKVIRTKCWLFA